MIKRLLVIPARSGSKRIKNKNIKFFFGKPIIYYPLELAVKSKLFDTIHVSTDSQKIANIVKKIGKFSDFLRPKKLSKDDTPLIPVLEYVVKKYELKGIKFDEIWSILPCSPLLKIKDIRECAKLMKKYNNPVIAVSPFMAPISWSFQIKKNFIFRANEEKIRDKRLSKISSYYDSGQIYCFPINILKKNQFSFKKKIITHKLPFERSVDIDTIENWNFAKILHKGLLKQK
mgnify:CR=1 FL=1